MKERMECDELVKLPNGEIVDCEVVSDVNLLRGTCDLVSVRPLISAEVGEMIEYGPCILNTLSSEEIHELKEAQLGHAED